jgi:hypothetical protein
MSTDINRRLGQVKYTGTLLDSHIAEIQLLYTHVVPLDLRFDAAEDVYYMKGLCKAFRKIAPGELIPHYRVTFTKKLVAKPKEKYGEEILDPPTYTTELHFEEVIQ